MTTAGAVEERRCRETGDVVALLDLRDPDAAWAGSEEEEGQRWMLLCAAHGGLLSLPTRSDARAMMGHPSEWCPACQES